MKPLTFTLMVLACFAQAPLPELHTDAVDAGSIFHVKNNFSKALVAYSIELVGYPGSFYTFIVDEVNGQSVKPVRLRKSAQPPPFDRRFLAAVGLPPKAFARIIRFQALLAAYRTEDFPRWGGLALACGFSD